MILSDKIMKFFLFFFLMSFSWIWISKVFPISTAANISQHQILFITGNGRVVETENLKKVLDAISKIK